MQNRILLVDDEPNVLEGLKRQLRKNYQIQIAEGGAAALDVLQQEEPYAVIVADMNMPAMNGVELLSRVQKQWPDTVRLMLTGNADQQTAMDAVNKGNVFRFLTKPCAKEDLQLAIDAAIRQHKLITAEHELLQGTLKGSVKLLTDILSITNPDSFGLALKARKAAISIANEMGIKNTWSLALAAMLAPIAQVTVPPEITAKLRDGTRLTDPELMIIEQLPRVAHDLLINIPRLQPIANLLYLRNKHFDGNGFPADELAGEEIPVEARILIIAWDMVEIMSDRLATGQALALMKGQKGKYDPHILSTAEVLFTNNKPEDKAPASVALWLLQPGQVLASNIETIEGQVLLVAGSLLSDTMIARIHNYSKIHRIKDEVWIE